MDDVRAKREKTLPELAREEFFEAKAKSEKAARFRLLWSYGPMLFPVVCGMVAIAVMSGVALPVRVFLPLILVTLVLFLWGTRRSRRYCEAMRRQEQAALRALWPW